MPRFLLFLVISSVPSCPKKETKDSQFSENQILCMTVHCIATGWATVDVLLANKSLPKYKELEINSVKMLLTFSQWYSNQNPTFLPQKIDFFFYKYILIQTILFLCQEKKKKSHIQTGLLGVFRYKQTPKQAGAQGVSGGLQTHKHHFTH